LVCSRGRRLIAPFSSPYRHNYLRRTQATGGPKTSAGGVRFEKPALDGRRRSALGGAFSITNSTFSGKYRRRRTGAAADGGSLCIHRRTAALSRIAPSPQSGHGRLMGGLLNEVRNRRGFTQAAVSGQGQGIGPLTICTSWGTPPRRKGTPALQLTGRVLLASRASQKLIRCKIADNIAQGERRRAQDLQWRRRNRRLAPEPLGSTNGLTLTNRTISGNSAVAGNWPPQRKVV